MEIPLDLLFYVLAFTAKRVNPTRKQKGFYWIEAKSIWGLRI
jgi:hypothetical protein